MESIWKNVPDEELDRIYEYINDMMEKGEWNDLTRMFHSFLDKVEEMPIDIMLAYIIATRPAGSKIGFRRQFIDLCKKKYPCDLEEPNEDLWYGL